MGERNTLGRFLRQHRRERGLTGSELADTLGVSQGTISKLESGRLDADLDFLAKFVQTLRLPRKDAAKLMRLAGVAPGRPVVDRVLQYLPADFLSRDFSRRRQETLLLAEERSKIIRAFNPLLVPGLLQCEAYARHVLATGGVRGDASIRRATTSRLRRQRVLQVREKRFTFLLTEAALLMRVGPPEVCAQQLLHLKHLSGLPGLRIGILGFATARCVLPPPGFYLLDNRVYVELPHGDLWFLERSNAIETYRPLFERLSEQAAFGSAFCSILDKHLQRLG